MRANILNIKIVMAKECLSVHDICKNSQLPKTTLNNVMSGRSVRPATLGRVARALGVDVSDIMELEEG